MNKRTLFENEQMKAIVSIPGWAQEYMDGGTATDKVKSASEAYCYVPLVYRAVQLRMKSIMSVPYHLERNGADVNTGFPVQFEAFYPLGFREIIGMTEAAMLLSGGCIWKRRRNAGSTTRVVQWVNPNITEVQYAGGEVDFIIDGKEHLTIDDVIYFRKFNPLDDVGFGVGSGMAGLPSAKLLHYMNLFAGQFFEHGAMPQVILGVPNGTSIDETKRLEGWFKQRAQGIRNAFKALAIRTGDGGVTPTTLTPEMKSLALTELYEQSKQQVAQAFEIPQTLLEDAANFATAEEHRITFWHDVVRPEGELLQEIINQQLLSQYGYTLVFDFDQMDQFQEDEEQRSAAFFNYVHSRAVPPSVAAEMLGLELPNDVEYAELDEWYREQTIIKPQILGQTGNQQQIEPEVDSPRKAYIEEVRKWRTRALKRIKAGKDGVGERSFESDIIPQILIDSTEAQLEGASEVKARFIFDALETWEGYP